MESRVDRLIEDLYASATDAALLPAFLEQYADAVGASSGVVIVLTDAATGSGQLLCSARTEDRYSALYEQYYSRRNVYVEALRRRNIRFLVAPGEDLCPDRELVRSEYYNDYLRPQGVRYSLGMVYASTEMHAHLGATRPWASGEFDTGETRIAEVMGRHFSQAMALYNRFYRLQRHCEALEDLAERQPYGVIWLDAQGRISSANAIGSRLLAAGDGLRVEKGVLRAGLAGETKRLQQLIGAAIGRQAQWGGSMRIARRSGARSYAVTITRARAAGVCHSAIVIVVDPLRPSRLDPVRLCELFELTPAEGRVCVLLAGGLTPVEIAGELGMAIGTVRSHLKHIFLKTETDRQAELVRLLLTCGAGVESGADLR